MFKNLSLILLALDLFSGLSFIFESIQQGKEPSVGPFAGRIFDKLVPASMKEPRGTVSREEFIGAVFHVFQLFMRSKKVS